MTNITLPITRVIGTLSVLILSLLVAVPAWAAESQSGVIKVSPTLRLNQLSGQPDSTMVELRNGRQVRLGELRRIEQMAVKLRAAPKVARVPPELRFKPAGTGVSVKSASELAAVLSKPDSTTVLLANGQRATVGQLKFVRSRVEGRLGRSLDKAPPGLSGPAIAVGRDADWQALLKKPDATVLESPSGKRITVGQLRHAINSKQVPMPASGKGGRL